MGRYRLPYHMGRLARIHLISPTNHERKHMKRKTMATGAGGGQQRPTDQSTTTPTKTAPTKTTPTKKTK
jgi:hypothetical protein